MATESRKRTNRTNIKNLKREVFYHYTPVEESGQWVVKCAKCGIEDLDLLCLHHKANNGKDDRSQYGWGAKYWHSLQRRGYPLGLEVLCYNCNTKARMKD